MSAKVHPDVPINELPRVMVVQSLLVVMLLMLLVDNVVERLKSKVGADNAIDETARSKMQI